MPGKQPWSSGGPWTAGRVQCWSRSRTCWWGSSISSWWGSSLGPSCSLQGCCWDLGSCVTPSSCTARPTTARPTCMTRPPWPCWWRASPSWCLCWCSRWPPTAAWPGTSSCATASSPTAKPSTRTCRPPATATPPPAAAAPRTATPRRKSGSEAWGREGAQARFRGLASPPHQTGYFAAVRCAAARPALTSGPQTHWPALLAFSPFRGSLATKLHPAQDAPLQEPRARPGWGKGRGRL